MSFFWKLSGCYQDITLGHSMEYIAIMVFSDLSFCVE